jgi:hypothetical protein
LWPWQRDRFVAQFSEGTSFLGVDPAKLAGDVLHVRFGKDAEIASAAMWPNVP